MLKQLTYSLMAAAALSLGFTSCSSDDPEMLPGQEGNVTFTVNLPASMATRAYADGLTARNLDCYVYSGGNLVAQQSVTFPAGSLQKQVSFNLANGRDYALVFFAHAANGCPYTYKTTDATITANYTGAASDDENFDAFYNVATTGKLTGPITQDVHLYRPFAQINFGTDDYVATDPTAAGATVDATTGGYIGNLKCGMTMDTQVNTVLKVLNNAKDAKADPANAGDVDVPVNVSFSMQTPPDPQTETFPVAGYKYLSMDYILVPADRSMVNLTFNIQGDNLSNTISMTNIPVQRNYRTNIYGHLLTSQTDWNVIIEPDFDGEYPYPSDYPYLTPTRTISSPADLAALARVQSATPIVAEIPAGTTVQMGQGDTFEPLSDVVLNIAGELRFTNGYGYMQPNTGKTLTIDMRQGGKIVTDNVLLVNYWGKQVNIYGGTIESTADNYEYVLEPNDNPIVLDGVTINTPDAVLTATNNGNVKMNNCTINCTVDRDVFYTDSGDNVTFVMTGCTVNAPNASWVFEVHDGTFTFADNTVVGGTQNVLNSDGAVSIASGSYKLSANAPATRTAIDVTAGGSLAITGGTFQGCPQLGGADFQLPAGHTWQTQTVGGITYYTVQ